MKQQVIVIHGGTTFDKHEDYISYLKNRVVTIDDFKLWTDWKGNLQEKLGEKFEVLFPRMPNGTNARYGEWKIWFERIFPFLTDNPILIGHSLGGIFLAKYLSETNFPETINATILVAAPFDDENLGESLADFKLPLTLSKLMKQGGKIYLIQSKDDPVVPFKQLAKYKQVLPKAEEIILKGRGHFKQEAFPELVELIKKL